MALTLVQLHAIAMILSWMFFGSTGILFARYGRSLRFGNRRQLLGKAIWFQIHRFLLSLAPLLTLLGFFFILVNAGGKWVNPQIFGIRLFAHSVLGGIIVCCTMIQIWLALYRCNPHSRFRFIFDWSHRIIGLLVFVLSVPTIFLIITLLPNYRTALITIDSLWIGWMVFIIVVFERIDSRQRVAASTIVINVLGGNGNQETTNTNSRPDVEAGTNMNIGTRYLNQMKLLLLLIHIFVSLTLSIALIVFICN